MSSEPSTQLKPTSAVAGGTAADLADPVSPLSTPDQGTGTAVLERPETEEQTDRSDNGDATGSRTMCRAIASPNRAHRPARGRAVRQDLGAEARPVAIPRLPGLQAHL